MKGTMMRIYLAIVLLCTVLALSNYEDTTDSNGLSLADRLFGDMVEEAIKADTASMAPFVRNVSEDLRFNKEVVKAAAKIKQNGWENKGVTIDWFAHLDAIAAAEGSGVSPFPAPNSVYGSGAGQPANAPYGGDTGVLTNESDDIAMFPGSRIVRAIDDLLE